VTNVVSALTARTQLGQIMKRISQNNERFVIDRRGQPIGIIMSIKDYINTVAPTPKELRVMQERAKQTGMNKLSMRQIDNLIAEVRLQERGKNNTKHQTK
jgi:PHD/YefM family antitoxin component YafN of YafNO toxin-antitoxin module